MIMLHFHSSHPQFSFWLLKKREVWLCFPSVVIIKTFDVLFVVKLTDWLSQPVCARSQVDCTVDLLLSAYKQTNWMRTRVQDGKRNVCYEPMPSWNSSGATERAPEAGKGWRWQWPSQRCQKTFPRGKKESLTETRMGIRYGKQSTLRVLITFQEWLRSSSCCLEILP